MIRIRTETPAPFTPQEVWVSPALKDAINAIPAEVFGEIDLGGPSTIGLSTYKKSRGTMVQVESPFSTGYTVTMPDPPTMGSIVATFDVPQEVFYGVRANPCC